MRSVATILMLGLAGCTHPAVKVASTPEPCPGSGIDLEAYHTPWRLVPSGVDWHQSFRARIGASMPSASSMILIRVSRGHYTSATFSIVAFRDTDGLWQSDVARETGGRLLQMPTKVELGERIKLSPEASARIDAILSDHCLWSEPTTFVLKKPPGVGSAQAWIDLVTPTRTRSAEGFSPIPGLTGELWDLISEF